MNKNQINSQLVEARYTTSLPNPAAEQQYAAPDIEIIDIEISQNILGGSNEADGVGNGGFW